MALKRGDVIEFDYELWVEGTDRLHDTTLAEAAKAAGLFDAEAYYAPMAYVLGSGRVIPGLERALLAAAPGKTEEVALAAPDAYGERDAALVETLPMGEFKKNDVEPHVGLALSYKNRRGVVTTVGGGRVRVDFNAPLAGKSLRYRFTVRRVAKTDAERLAGLLRMHFPAPIEWAVTAGPVAGKPTATVEVPEAALYHRNWLAAKFRVLMDAREYTGLDQVRFVETYALPRSPASSGAAAPAPAPPAPSAGRAGA